jgi:capsid portal protein
MRKSDSFIVTVDDTGEYNVVDRMELDRHALKAKVDYDGSKQVVDEQFKAGVHVLEPRYNPYDLVQLLDLYTYHAACVDAVAVDSTGIDYTLKPVEDVEPIDAEKERFITVLENCKPSINNNLQKMVFDRRAIGYGALELIRETTSDSLQASS